MTQRVVAAQAAPRADQQPEPMIETIAYLAGGHRRHSRRGQLNRQRDAVEAATDFDDRASLVSIVQREARSHIARPFDEQIDCGRVDSAADIQRGYDPQLLV